MTEQLVHDRENERAVLSACLYSPRARKVAREHLVRDDFYEPWHERIWVAMEELDASDKPVDALTVASAVAGNKACLEVLPMIMSIVAVPDNVSAYAEAVRGWAVRRRAMEVATRLAQRARSLDVDPYGLITDTINRLTGLRDTGSGEVETRLLADLLAEADDPYDWAVPGLLEKADRLVLTGEEGLGKSYIARQLGIFAAAGIHPFLLDKIEPVRVQILDHENSWSQIRRGSRRLWNFAVANGCDPRPNVHVAALNRVDITRDKDLSRLHREVDIANPDVIIVGPLYKLTPRAIQTDDEAAPILAALDTFRERGCALVIEAHAGHTKSMDGGRDLRPRGSSALLGWPEFGYGMRAEKDGRCRLVPWRGDRSERGWPQYLRRAVDPATRSTHWLPDLEHEVR
jgi:replicative DNA helicase